MIQTHSLIITIFDINDVNILVAIIIFLDEDYCCSTLSISGGSTVNKLYPQLIGTYHKFDTPNNKSVYKQEDKEYYLYRSTSQYALHPDIEMWMVIQDKNKQILFIVFHCRLICTFSCRILFNFNIHMLIGF